MEKDTRDPDEIEERIAEILGYCRSDGELHDPREFVEKYAGMRWQCPDCDLTVNKTNYKRASDLKWVITPSTSTSPTSTDADGTERSETSSEEKTSLLDNVQKVQDSLLGDEDASLQDQVESLTGEGNSDTSDSNSEHSTEEVDGNG